MVEMLHSADMDGIIVSPTTIVQEYIKILQSFMIETNVDNGTGVLKLVHRDGVSHLTYPMTLSNGL